MAQDFKDNRLKISVGAAAASGLLRPRDIAVILLCLAPIFAAAWFTLRYAYRMPFWDEWEMAFLFRNFQGGYLSLGDLYRQQNEHRMLFPKAILVSVGLITRWETRLEPLITEAAMAMTLWVVYIRAARQFSFPLWRPPLWFIPVSFLIFTWRQSEMFLCGMLLAFVMPAAFGLLSLYRLERALEGFCGGGIITDNKGGDESGGEARTTAKFGAETGSKCGAGCRAETEAKFGAATGAKFGAKFGAATGAKFGVGYGAKREFAAALVWATVATFSSLHGFFVWTSGLLMAAIFFIGTKRGFKAQSADTRAADTAEAKLAGAKPAEAKPTEAKTAPPTNLSSDGASSTGASSTGASSAQASPARASVLRAAGAWAAAALIEGIIYFAGLQSPAESPDLFYALKHPLVFLKYFMTVTGSVMPEGGAALIYGASVAATIPVCLLIVARGKTVRQNAFWLSMLAYSTAALLAVSAGRAGMGIEQALSPRYTTFGILSAVALCVMITGHARRMSDAARGALLAAAALALIIVPLKPSYESGLADGRAAKQVSRAAALESLTGYRCVTNTELERLRVYPDPCWLRIYLGIIERAGVSVFNTGEAKNRAARTASTRTSWGRCP
jgi:hypothetical protein